MRIRRRMVWGLLLLVFLGLVGTAAGFYLAGYRAYVVRTGSMVPTLDPGDLIIDRPFDGQPEVGEMITFQSNGGQSEVITHRVVAVDRSGTNTKGDANRSSDAWTLPNQAIHGVVTARIPKFGYVVVFLQQTTGLLSIATCLITLVLLWQLFFPSSPKNKAAAESASVETAAEAAPCPSTVGNAAEPDRAPDGNEPDLDWIPGFDPAQPATISQT